MEIAHETEQALKRQIADVMKRHLDFEKYKVFFFGSRVSGTPRDGSDIDVGIEGPAPVPNDALLALQDEVDALPTLYKIEIVDFFRVSDKFKEVAKEREYLT